jgi:hypothetical protein
LEPDRSSARLTEKRVTFAEISDESTDEELDAFLDALGLPAEVSRGAAPVHATQEQADQSKEEAIGDP